MFIRIAFVLGAAFALSLPMNAAQAQRPPSRIPSWVNGVDLPTLTWYYGCAMGSKVPMCDWVATARITPDPGEEPLWYVLLYAGGDQVTGGYTWGLYDMWWWRSASEDCTGAESHVYVWVKCAPYMKSMIWGSQVTGFSPSGDEFRYRIEFHPVVTPEPGTMALLATGLSGLGLGLWRRRRRTPQR